MAQWIKFTEEDIPKLPIDRPMLVQTLQKVYGNPRKFPVVEAIEFQKEWKAFYMLRTLESCCDSEEEVDFNLIVEWLDDGLHIKNPRSA